MSNENDMCLPDFDIDFYKPVKRRSSILKSVDTNYMSEFKADDRRGSRRVSWAQTYQYKELHPDGTAVTVSQELKTKCEQIASSQSSEDMNEREVDCDVENDANQSNVQLIKASDFINKLKKANTSIATNNDNKRQSSDALGQDLSPKVKRVKKSNTKSLTNYLAKHYKTDDEKDYETVFNTSFNKYGRELVPRVERPEFTLLFSEKSDAMDITEMDLNRKSEVSEEICEFMSDVNTTHTNIENVESITSDMSITGMNTTHINLDGFQSMESDMELTDMNSKLKNIDEKVLSLKSDMDLTEMNTTHNTTNLSTVDTNTDKNVPSIASDMSITNKSMTDTHIHESVASITSDLSITGMNTTHINTNENVSPVQSIRVDVNIVEVNTTHINESVQSIASEMDLTDMNSSHKDIEENVKSLASDMDVTMDTTHINTTNLSTAETNSTTVSNNTRDVSAKILPSKIPLSSQRKSFLPTIQLPVNTSVSLSKQNKRAIPPKLSMGWLAQSSIRTNFNNTVNNNVKRMSIPMNPLIAKPNALTLSIPSLIKESIEETPTVVTNSEVNLDFNKTDNTCSSAIKNTIMARTELTKSMVKNTFGFGITEKLKQKRNEFEAKRVDESPKPLTSNNSSCSSQARKSLKFDSTKKVEQNETITKQISKSICEPINQNNESFSSSESKRQSYERSVSTTNDKTGSTNTATESSATAVTEIENDLVLESIESIEFSSTCNSISSTETTKCFVSSPPSIDMTLNLSCNPFNSPEEDFNPFIHTERSFHADSSFYQSYSVSPLQLSFMVRDDTLRILSDQLEREINDMEIPIEEQTKRSIQSNNQTFGILDNLEKIAKHNCFTIQDVNDEKALISYLWNTFVLDLRFGSVLESDSLVSIKEIISINMESLVKPEESLNMTQNELILKFNDSHKPLITIAHDLIISSFESERTQFINKYKTTDSINELIAAISVKVLSAKQLLSELRIISSTQLCKLYPKQNGCYSLVVEVIGIRHAFLLILPINPKTYPDEVIHPMFKFHKQDKHLYCLNELSAALLMIESRKFDYLQRLIKATKLFIRAKKKVMVDKQRKLKQKKDIESAKLDNY